MIARRLTLTASSALCALAAMIAFAGAPAQAFLTHAYSPAVSAQINKGIPVEGPHGEPIAQPGPLELGSLSMTVDSGHLWTVEGRDRIDEFDAATGAFLSQLTTAPEGVRFGVGNGGTAGIAIGHSTGEAVIYVGESVSGGAVVATYDEAGASKDTWTGAATPAGSFSPEGMEVAVDDSTSPFDEHRGDVYVASERRASAPAAIDVFHPEADGLEHYVGQITGTSPGEPFEYVERVAVNDLNGDVIAIADKAVDIFEADGLGGFVLAHRITGPRTGPFSQPFNLAVDEATGELYVDDLDAEVSGAVIDEFSSAGAYLGRITGADVPGGSLGEPFAVAVDSASHDVFIGNAALHEMDVFGPDIVFPEVSSEPASGVGPFGATLNGTVDPENAGAATCRFEWGTSKLFGKVAPCQPEAVADGGSAVAVHATLIGLQPDTTYFYRLQASNANGTNPGEASQDQELTTSGPGIREASVTDLASTSVTFDARIDPHGVPTSYYLQYGTSAAYGSDVPGPPGEAIGSGEGDLDVPPHHVQGLQAGTVYHYRVVVVSEPSPGELSVFDGPDRAFTTQTAAVSELPDGRQWEMVSPPDKKGATIAPISENGVLQAAAGGGAISYLADLPTEAQPQGYSNEVQVLSTRGAEGWSTRDIALPHADATGASIGEGQEYRLFSSDLSLAAVQPFGNFIPGLSAEASEPTAMLRTLNASCSPGSCYRPLVTGKPGVANVPPGTVFGGAPEGRCEFLYCGPRFVDGTSDLSHVVFDSSALDSGEGDSPFEWSNGALAPLGVLPDGSPTEGLSLGNEDDFRGAISTDGSRVVLSSGLGAIYMRDVALRKTIQLNVADPACLAEGKCVNEKTGRSEYGSFQLASADGSKVFFTDNRQLTSDAEDLVGVGKRTLYECEVVEVAGGPQCRLSDLAGEALGVVGASEDGSYLYFVAESALAQGALAGEPNLYVRHGGVTKLIAALSVEDEHDWTESLGNLSSRVSPDGGWVEFMSQRSLTGYDNRDAVSGELDAEVYLFDAATGRVICASCDPTGARPTGAEYFKLEPGSGGLTGGPRGVWNNSDWVAAIVPGWLQFKIGNSANQPRYLSDSGRLFFNSGDALVPQDVNGTQDVYEWEPAGVGSCSAASTTFDGSSGGCIGLISSGTSAEESGFLDASEDGGDVFFLTFSKLRPQDYDNALDVYDAHECASSAPCFPVAVPQPPACTTADACRAAPAPQPAIFGAPSSATFSGAGNVVAGSGGVVMPKSLTRAQKLAGALKTCKHRPKRKRAACMRRARARYGHVKPGKAASRKKGNR
jgi:hypothetical protein